MDDVEKFLEFLYNGLEGFVAVTVIKDGKVGDTFFEWPREKQLIPPYMEQRKTDGNVYVTPSILSTRSRKKEAFKASNVLWADYDGAIPSFPVGFPHGGMIVRSSSADKCHIYWKLDSPIDDKVVLEDYNRRIAYGTSGDISGWDCTQLLRPPRTINYKYGEGIETGLDHYDPIPVPLVAISLPDVSIPQGLSAPSVLPDIQILIKDLPSELKELFNAKIYAPNRSSFLMSAGYRFVESGYDLAPTVALLNLLDSKTVRKFSQRMDRMLRYTEIASIALAKTGPKKITGSKFLDIKDMQERLDFILDGWIHTNGIMLLSGSPGVGKTQLAMQLGYCLTTGEEFLQRKVIKPQKVMFLSLEMKAIEMQYIIRHQVRGMKDPETWNDNSLFFDPPHENLDVYGDLIKGYQPTVVIIDSLSELATDDMKETEARRITRWWDKVRYDLNTALVVVHHDRKATDSNKKPNKLSDVYGSYLFAKTPETVTTLWEDSTSTKQEKPIQLIALKARMAKKGEQFVTRDDNLWFSADAPQVNGKTTGEEDEVDVGKQHGTTQFNGPANLGF